MSPKRRRQTSKIDDRMPGFTGQPLPTDEIMSADIPRRPRSKGTSALESPASLAALKGGVSIDQALAAFRAGCNTSADRLWVTDDWIAPYLKKLRNLLSDTVTATEAQMLREVVLKQQPLDLGMSWLAENPRPSWREFLRLRERKAEAWRREMRTAIDDTRVERARKIAAGPPFRELKGGLSIRHALAAFLEGCNHKGRLFITDSWIEPKLEVMQQRLHEPITDEEAAVLRGAVLGQYPLELVVNWLKKKKARHLGGTDGPA